MALDSYSLGNLNPMAAYLESAQGIQQLQDNQQVMQQRQATFDIAAQDREAKQQAAQLAAEQAQAAALQKQQDQQALFEGNYSPAAVARYTARYPDDHQAVKLGYEAMDTAKKADMFGFANRIESAYMAGQPELVQRLLDTRVAQLTSGGAPKQEIDAMQTFSDLNKVNPRGTVTMLATAAAAADPAKYQESRKTMVDIKKTEQEIEGLKVLQPLEVEAKRAGIDLTKAQTFASGAGVLNDLAKLKLEKLKELQASQGVQLSDAAMKVQSGYVDSATTARSSGNTADALANGFLTLDPLSTPAATLAEWTKRLSGGSDEISNLRKNYIMFKNQGALTMLPPGAASENDMKRVLEGFPEGNTNPKTMASWLKSYAKVQQDSAVANELKAEWISAVGNLGRTTKDITMGEVVVPAGTTFSRFLPLAMKNAGKTSAVANTSADPTARYAKYAK